MNEEEMIEKNGIYESNVNNAQKISNAEIAGSLRTFANTSLFYSVFGVVFFVVLGVFYAFLMVYSTKMNLGSLSIAFYLFSGVMICCIITLLISMIVYYSSLKALSRANTCFEEAYKIKKKQFVAGLLRAVAGAASRGSRSTSGKAAASGVQAGASMYSFIKEFDFLGCMEAGIGYELQKSNSQSLISEGEKVFRSKRTLMKVAVGLAIGAALIAIPSVVLVFESGNGNIYLPIALVAICILGGVIAELAIEFKLCKYLKAAADEIEKTPEYTAF